MTDKERDRIECAIRHIQTAVDVDPWAAEIAVAAMRELFGNSEQLETHDKRTETHACDCISRKAAIETALTFFVEYLGGAFHEEQQKELAGRLEALPSAQPEIIACGDCKHWVCHDRRCGYWNHGVKPLDWCCHAERRTNG